MENKWTPKATETNTSLQLNKQNHFHILVNLFQLFGFGLVFWKLK